MVFLWILEKVITQIMPIIDGYSKYHAGFRCDFGGKDITEYMIGLIIKSGRKYFNIYSNKDKEIAKDIKEKSLKTALDFLEELQIESFGYELPDKSHICIKEERI